MDTKEACKRIIIALDFKTKQDVEEFLDKFDAIGDQAECCPKFVKVGMELFYSVGPEIISWLKDRNLDIFLDLKVHDIPNTTAQAICSLAQQFGVDIVNLHAAGGIEMMSRAKTALDDAWTNVQDELRLDFDNEIDKPKLIAVTVLTSHDQGSIENELGYKDININDLILKLAGNAYTAGLNGVVCSALEAKMIKDAVPQEREFITVCPGVRLPDGDSNDQKRVVTPKAAFENGADYIVVGRAITKSEDPVKAFQEVVNSITECKNFCFETN